MGIENKRVLLAVTDIEVTREKTSCLLESKPLDEKMQDVVIAFLGNDLGASEVLVSASTITASIPNGDCNNQALSWIASWDHDSTANPPRISPPTKDSLN